jgi:hypothetical protein
MKAIAAKQAMTDLGNMLPSFAGFTSPNLLETSINVSTLI